ncbi:adenylate/guanylate cyclase domain-containing protein [Spirochaeta dissipatitropha]
MRPTRCSTILTSLLLFLLLPAVLSASGSVRALGAVLDLRDRDFTVDGAVELNGEWSFHWNELVDPYVFRAGQLTEQPQIWNRIPGQDFGGIGYASQQLRVLLPEAAVGKVLGLRITHVYTAYELYANGELIASNGIVSSESNAARAQYLPQAVYFQSDSPEVLFTLRMSNYEHSKGGLAEPLLIGRAGQIGELRERRIMAEMITVGILGIIGLYHFMIFMLRNKEKSALFFSLFCVIISFRTMLMGERLWYFFFPAFPWGIGQRLDYLTICLFYPMFVTFIRLIYPRELKKRLHLLILVLSGLFAIIIITTPTTFFTLILTYYNLLIALTGLLVIYALVLAAVRGRSGARLLLAGGIVFFLTALNDILYNRGLIQTTYLSTLGLVVFTVTQTIVLSYLFTRAYAIIEEINTSLWRFVPQEVLKYLGKEEIIDIKLGDQIHGTLTVLFADIRGFTGISEKMTPQENITFINAFLAETGPVIRKNGGFIDKYIGDAIMGIFPDSPLGAMNAALELQTAVNHFNQKYSQYDNIRVGVSVHSGPIMLGIIGELERLESTVISDTVNVAARIEKLNKKFGTDITISDSVYHEIRDEGFVTRFMGNVKIRGREQHIGVYELTGKTS